MKKMTTAVHIIIFALIFIVFLVTITFIQNNMTRAIQFSEISGEESSNSNSKIIVPTKKDRKNLQKCYDNVFTYLGSTEVLVDEINELYIQVQEAKKCSIANWYYNQLEEKYKQYQSKLDEIQVAICSYEEMYNVYVDALSTIPEFLVSLHTKKYTEFQEQVEPMYQKIMEQKQNYRQEEESLKTIKTDAKLIADEWYEATYYWMCKIVNAEAGSDWMPTIERCYVANVIENRIASPKFPNNIYDVIYAPGPQYAPTVDGSINKIPTERVKQDMEDYLRGRIQTGMPDDVLYQAKATWGRRIWKSMPSGHYFCFG